MDGARDDPDLSSPAFPGAQPRAARRSLWVLGALSLGFLIARGNHIAAGGAGEFSSWVWLGLSAATAISTLLIFGRGRFASWVCRAVLWCAVVLLGIGVYQRAIAERPADSLAWMLERTSRGTGAESGDRAGRPVVLGVNGWLRTPPREAMGSNGALGEFYRHERAWWFELEAESVEVEGRGALRVTGVLRVRLVADGGFDGARDANGTLLRAGDRVLVQGLALPISEALNPGEPDRAALAAQAHIVGSMSVPTEMLIRRLGDDAALPGSASSRARRWWAGRLAALRSEAERVLGDSLASEWTRETPHANDDSAPERRQNDPDTRTQHAREGRALIGAMLLGTREDGLDGISGAFTRLGLTHLVAISGVNMVLLAGFALAVMRLTGDRGALEPLTLAVLVGVYLLILPAQAPALRGGIMVLALLLADALGRRYDRLSVLGWVAVALVLVRPMELFSPGFQLSFGIVGALVWMGNSFHERLFGARIRGVQRSALPAGHAARFERYGVRVRRFLGACTEGIARAASASLLAWAVATPIVAYHMGLVSPAAVLTTIMVMPACALVLWAGYATLLIGALWRGLSTLGTYAGGLLGVGDGDSPHTSPPLIGEILDWLGARTVGLVRTLDALPGTSLHVPAMSLGVTLAALIVAVYWLRKGHLRDRRAWGASALVALWLGAELVSAGRLADNVSARLDVLAVGDGSCLLIRAKGADGETEAMLWDCGSPNPGAGVRLIPEALRALGVTRIDTAVISYADLDRFGALADVAASIRIGRVLVARRFLELAREGQDRPGLVSPVARAAGELVALLETQGVRVEVLDPSREWLLGEHRLRFVVGAHAHDGASGAEGDNRSTNESAGLEATALAAVLEVQTATHLERVLFTGSAGRDELLAIGAMLGAEHGEVIVLPRQGRRSAAAAELVGKALPRVVVVSSGARTASELMGAWAEDRAGPNAPRWWVTGVDGACWVEVKPGEGMQSGRSRHPATGIGHR